MSEKANKKVEVERIEILGKEFSTTEDKKKLFNANGSPNGIVNDLTGKVIEITDIVNSQREDEKTGEMFNRCVLFGKVEGEETSGRYVVNSEPFITRLEELVNVFGKPSVNEPLEVRVIKQQSTQTDNFYLTLELVD